MNGESIRKCIRAEPFVPFEIHFSGGEVHRVTHSELAWVPGSEVYVCYPDKGRVAWLSLLHVTSVEHVTNGKTKKKGGK
jgi:hypothetical protein